MLTLMKKMHTFCNVCWLKIIYCVGVYVYMHVHHTRVLFYIFFFFCKSSLKMDLVVRDDEGNIIDPQKTSTVEIYRQVSRWFICHYKILSASLLLNHLVSLLLHKNQNIFFEYPLYLLTNVINIALVQNKSMMWNLIDRNTRLKVNPDQIQRN